MNDGAGARETQSGSRGGFDRLERIRRRVLRLQRRGLFVDFDGREDMDNEIIKADKQYRKFVLAVCLIFIAAGGAIIVWLLSYLQDALEDSDPERALIAVKRLLILISLGIIPVGLYILSLGRKVVKSRQIPPPGVKVIADTKVIAGRKAVIRGWLLICIALLMIGLSLIGAAYAPYMLERSRCDGAGPESFGDCNAGSVSSKVDGASAAKREAGEGERSRQRAYDYKRRAEVALHFEDWDKIRVYKGRVGHGGVETEELVEVEDLAAELDSAGDERRLAAVVVSHRFADNYSNEAGTRALDKLGGIIREHGFVRIVFLSETSVGLRILRE